jgi:hypothetical protein
MTSRMTCTQFRDALDCYLDRELAPDAMAAADHHRADCPACDRLAVTARELKASVKQTVEAVPLPDGLEARIRLATAPRWTRPPAWMAAAAAAVILVVLAGGMMPERVERFAANAMDRLALRLDGSSDVELHGVLLCRDCELEHRYGIEAPCKKIGHHGAIATADGRIWNLVEQKAAADLIHDETLLGRQIVVRGRVFRGARALVIDSYQFQS